MKEQKMANWILLSPYFSLLESFTSQVTRFHSKEVKGLWRCRSVWTFERSHSGTSRQQLNLKLLRKSKVYVRMDIILPEKTVTRQNAGTEWKVSDNDVETNLTRKIFKIIWRGSRIQYVSCGMWVPERKQDSSRWLKPEVTLVLLNRKGPRDLMGVQEFRPRD
jgi:hypothetical protein